VDVIRRNLNSKETEYARCLCTSRDGYRCQLCKQPFGDTVADVHHKDGDSHNNPKNGSNWQLTHHTCNVLEYYIQKRFEAIDGEKPPPFEYSVGTKMELKWLRWMIQYLTDNTEISWDSARFTGALEADCSPETTKRYLMKHIADSEHPKSLFKTRMDAAYQHRIIFTDHTRDFIDRNKDLV